MKQRMTQSRAEHNDSIVCSSTHHNVATITVEDWDIIMGLSDVARRAWAYSLEDSDHQRHVDESMRMLELTLEAPDERGIEHPEDMHQNRFNPYW